MLKQIILFIFAITLSFASLAQDQAAPGASATINYQIPPNFPPSSGQGLGREVEGTYFSEKDRKIIYMSCKNVIGKLCSRKYREDGSSTRPRHFEGNVGAGMVSEQDAKCLASKTGMIASGGGGYLKKSKAQKKIRRYCPHGGWREVQSCLRMVSLLSSENLNVQPLQPTYRGAELYAEETRQ